MTTFLFCFVISANLLQTLKKVLSRVGFGRGRKWGGGGLGGFGVFAETSLLMDSTPCRSKFAYFGLTDRKFFLKASWEPIQTNFEGEAEAGADNKRIFGSKFFKKYLGKDCLLCFCFVAS